MKNLILSSSVTPLTIDDLRTVFGGDGDVVDPNDLIGGAAIVEDDYGI